jgi:hypothetical protein
MTICKPCPHFPGYYFGFEYSDVTCPFCLSEARVDKLEAALKEILRVTRRDRNGSAYVMKLAIDALAVPETFKGVTDAPMWIDDDQGNVVKVTASDRSAE